MPNTDSRARASREARGRTLLEAGNTPRREWHDLPRFADHVPEAAGPSDVVTGAFLGAVGGLFLGGAIAAILGAGLPVILIGMVFGGASAAAVGGLASGAGRRPWK